MTMSDNELLLVQAIRKAQSEYARGFVHAMQALQEHAAEACRFHPVAPDSARVTAGYLNGYHAGIDYHAGHSGLATRLKVFELGLEEVHEHYHSKPDGQPPRWS
jgi:hypothetical protein